MTEAATTTTTTFDTSGDLFRNSYLLDTNKRDTNHLSQGTIADHINYQLSQYDTGSILSNTTSTNTTESPITTFINNHTSNNDLIDRSEQHQVEHVLEWSPNKRYCRLNTLLGKGAFKVVHKAMDREEGYEVAWNVLHVTYIINGVDVIY
jgi:WNK lysine deficient protein kinase